MKKINLLLSLVILIIVSSCEQSSSRDKSSYSSSGPVSADHDQAAYQSYQPSETEKAREQVQLLYQQLALYKYQVNRVLEEDAQTPVTGNGSYRVQAQEMRKIDLDGCPDDFKLSYQEHVKAWSLAADIKEALTELRSDNNITATVIVSILARMDNSDATPILDELDKERRLEEADRQASDQIHSTWSKVVQVAGQYGVTVPANGSF